MQTRTYQFFGTASQANLANRQIIAPGIIYGITWGMYLSSSANGANILAELSFQSASQVSTDNAQGVIDFCTLFLNAAATGTTESQINKTITGLYIPVQIGQLIYLNTSLSGTAAVKALIYVSEGK